MYSGLFSFFAIGCGWFFAALVCGTPPHQVLSREASCCSAVLAPARSAILTATTHRGPESSPAEHRPAGHYEAETERTEEELRTQRVRTSPAAAVQPPVQTPAGCYSARTGRTALHHSQTLLQHLRTIILHC